MNKIPVDILYVSSIVKGFVAKTEVYGSVITTLFLLLLISTAETRTLPRSSSMAAGLEKNGRTRVQAVFSHAAGDNSTLLSFAEGDVITLLVPEARDGWHYGENEKTRMWVQNEMQQKKRQMQFCQDHCSQSWVVISTCSDLYSAHLERGVTE